MSEQYERDLMIAERIGRVEGRVDEISENSKRNITSHHNLVNKVHKHETDLSLSKQTLETMEAILSQLNKSVESLVHTRAFSKGTLIGLGLIFSFVSPVITALIIHLIKTNF